MNSSSLTVFVWTLLFISSGFVQLFYVDPGDICGGEAYSSIMAEPMDISSDDKSCPICDELLKNGSPTVVIREKGAININRASAQRNSNITVKSGDSVHRDCRRDFIDLRNVKTDNSEYACDSLTTRSSYTTFNFKSNCFFCTHKCNKICSEVHRVEQFNFTATIKELCNIRNDSWGNEVHARLVSVLDLQAAEAIYHQVCNVNFRTFKQVPDRFAKDEKSKKSPGRPQCTELLEGFKDVINYIESNEGAALSVKELVQVMEQTCG
ncbi:uncharacterized protein LOC123527311 isoform X2 [Mercenaria mercenaria]|uniref:uncharacterized protein LOC123527311 isoform X2 n=1 Tax=Mercenaria mercenaria TaxID=6596 RepID=UPI00234F96B4|nr:uncharacterized protein LOC123527311 isoform X2 [Mercenaria mercenaria]